MLIKSFKFDPEYFKSSFKWSFCLLIFFFNSCQLQEKHYNIRDCKVTYDVHFTTIDPNSIAGSMLPEKVTITYKKSKSKFELVIAYGLMRMTHISDSKDQSIISIVELGNQRKACKYNYKDIEKELEHLPEYDIDKTNEAKEIAGVLCKKAIVSDKTNNARFEVYYTETIEAENINWFNPYRSIESPLMYFTINHYNIEMDLKASKIDTLEIEDSFFEVKKENYEWLSKKEFENYINGLSMER